MRRHSGGSTASRADNGRRLRRRRGTCRTVARASTPAPPRIAAAPYTHLPAHQTLPDLVCRPLL
ncbi:hypothetical protein DIS09_35905 [Burkholderia pseudomallei]|nr:hypothetical protein DIS09_35905 [Burkholderia pseudomallei]